MGLKKIDWNSLSRMQSSVEFNVDDVGIIKTIADDFQLAEFEADYSGSMKYITNMNTYA